jgi:hypothetical protein
MTRTMFDRHHARIWRELRKLEATTADQPRARRNARARVLTAMRSLRAAVDEAFPPIVDRTGIKRADPQTRIKRLRASGWCECPSVAAARFATVGVPVKRVVWKVQTETPGSRRYVNGTGWVQEKSTYQTHTKEILFIPLWADAIGLDAARIREAKKSRKIRNAAIVAMALS